MKRSILISLLAAIFLCLVGAVTVQIGKNMSTVVPVPGGDAMMVQDSPLMPIGFIIAVVGALTLIATLSWFLVDFIRGRRAKKKK